MTNSCQIVSISSHVRNNLGAAWRDFAPRGRLFQRARCPGANEVWNLGIAGCRIVNEPIAKNMKNFLLLCLATALAVTTASADTKIVIKGSDTLGAKLVPQLAEAYKASHPGVSFDIAAEGSTTGIAAIIDGTADIGMASRRAFDTEISAAAANGRTLKPTIVAYDGIAIIVNTANPVCER